MLVGVAVNAGVAVLVDMVVGVRVGVLVTVGLFVIVGVFVTVKVAVGVRIGVGVKVFVGVGASTVNAVLARRQRRICTGGGSVVESCDPDNAGCGQLCRRSGMRLRMRTEGCQRKSVKFGAIVAAVHTAFTARVKYHVQRRSRSDDRPDALCYFSALKSSRCAPMSM